MEWIMWCGIAILAVLAVWWIAKITATYWVPVEKSGLIFLKSALAKQGVDVKRIPDAALEEILALKIKGAKGMAMAAQIASNMPNDKNWRANLVRLLQGEAEIMRDILEQGAQRHSFHDSTTILVKYGLVS